MPLKPQHLAGVFLRPNMAPKNYNVNLALSNCKFNVS